MARSRDVSGSEEIVRAEELFQKSVQDGNPDFRYVALAIASQPAFPPPWAMLACISELEATRQRAAKKATKANKMDRMLDGIALAYVVELDRRDDPKFGEQPEPSFNEMVRRAHQNTFHKPLQKASENDTYRSYKRQWDAEQNHAAIEGESPFLGVKVTPRIQAVLNQFYAEQLDAPEATEREIYILHVLKWAEDRGINTDHFWRSEGPE
ncbi:hypothetical protein AUC45_11130 [Erythrobacter sp. YT30]|nr:hypothetical protein AUC45_11130 [Erythrobacter sp. YT30]